MKEKVSDAIHIREGGPALSICRKNKEICTFLRNGYPDARPVDV